MRKIIDAVILNLEQTKALLNSLDDRIYSNKSILPYRASIGEHIRHIMDIFDCTLSGIAQNRVDLTARKRDPGAELKTAAGIEYINNIEQRVKALSGIDKNRLLTVTDDPGTGMLKTDYSAGGILCQAQSHAIHHNAFIGYILHALGQAVPGGGFGYNPTTPDGNPNTPDGNPNTPDGNPNIPDS